MVKGTKMEINRVTKLYKNDFKAIDNVSLSIKEGEFLTILGPSGSGKSTLLKLIAGFEKITEGTIFLDSEDISKKEPHHRNIGMLFQNYALFPHMTIYDNVAYPLKNRKMSKAKVKEKVDKILDLVQLSHLTDRRPSQLSGGQQQRVALARSMVFNPPILLLDEPLGALDKQLRQQMQIEIKHIQETAGITTISVTHDQEEALTMSDRICVMNEGRIMQIDTPANLYRRPANKFVAQFIGEINLIEGTIVNIEDDKVFIQVSNNDKNESVFISELKNKKGKNNLLNKKVSLALRPEDILICDSDRRFDNEIELTVKEVIYMGDSLKVQATTPPGLEISIKAPHYKAHLIHLSESIKVGWDYKYATYVLSEAEVEKSGIEVEMKIKELVFN